MDKERFAVLGKKILKTVGKMSVPYVAKKIVSKRVKDVCDRFNISEKRAEELSSDLFNILKLFIEEEVNNVPIPKVELKQNINHLAYTALNVAREIPDGEQFVDMLISGINSLDTGQIDEILDVLDVEWAEYKEYIQEALRYVKNEIEKERVATNNIEEASAIENISQPKRVIETKISETPSDVIEIGATVEDVNIHQTIGDELMSEEDENLFIQSLQNQLLKVNFSSPEAAKETIKQYITATENVAKFIEIQETKRVAIRCHSEEVISRINAMSNIISQYLDKVFDERKMIFKKQFECVDAALASGNIEMLGLSLNAINKLAESSPFKALSDVTVVKSMLESGEEFDI